LQLFFRVRQLWRDLFPARRLAMTEHTETLDDHAEVETTVVDPVVARLQDELAALRKEKTAIEDTYRQHAAALDKAKAEFTGARERMQRENDRNQKREQVKAVQGLLPVLDTLDRSIEAARKEQVAPAFVDGIAIVRHQFDQVLSGLGLSRFDDLGQPFDPARHQAVTTMPVLEESQDNTVLHVMASGCMVGDEVVRTATVVVGKFAGVVGEA
jgi:molecular chaperone GrpE